MKKYIEVLVIINFCIGVILAVMVSFMSGFYIREKLSVPKQNERPRTFIIPRSNGNRRKENERKNYVCFNRGKQKLAKIEFN